MNKETFKNVIGILIGYAILASIAYLGLCLASQHEYIWPSFSAGMIGIAHMSMIPVLFKISFKLEES